MEQANQEKMSISSTNNTNNINLNNYKALDQSPILDYASGLFFVSLLCRSLGTSCDKRKSFPLIVPATLLFAKKGPYKLNWPAIENLLKPVGWEIISAYYRPYDPNSSIDLNKLDSMSKHEDYPIGMDQFDLLNYISTSQEIEAFSKDQIYIPIITPVSRKTLAPGDFYLGQKKTIAVDSINFLIDHVLSIEDTFTKLIQIACITNLNIDGWQNNILLTFYLLLNPNVCFKIKQEFINEVSEIARPFLTLVLKLLRLRNQYTHTFYRETEVHKEINHFFLMAQHVLKQKKVEQSQLVSLITQATNLELLFIKSIYYEFV